MTRRAFCLIRAEPHYRRDAFMAGLKAAGYDARTGAPSSVQAGDVVCMWNRYSENHQLANRVEAAGGIVLVAENGYVGPGGVSPHQMDPREIYALAIGGHNGSGTWAVGGPERWDALGVELKPWRTDGEHILICPNRSFGRPDMIMPLNWAHDVAKRLLRITKRPIRIRPHPGNGAPTKPLADDLRGAHACVIWSSSAGLQALIAGVPVIREAPHWIAEHAAWSDIVAVEDSQCAASVMATTDEHDDCGRPFTMRRLAWAQWHVSEIATGEPFRHLLRKSDPQLSRTLAAAEGGSQAATPHLALAVARFGEA